MSLADDLNLKPVIWGEHHAQRKVPAPSDRPKVRISRAKRQRINDDAVYLAMRDEYLNANPICCNCPKFASCVHHVCRGVYRANSLLNVDTWLGCCIECHEKIECMTIAAQIKLKQQTVAETIKRLRK
jgi:hypothetical protein